jgi:hypothetical protein
VGEGQGEGEGDGGSATRPKRPKRSRL